MEFFIVVYPWVVAKSRKKSEDGEGKKSFKNKDIKSLIEKCLKLLFKTFRCSFAGVLVVLQAYKFISRFIYCNNFMLPSVVPESRH